MQEYVYFEGKFQEAKNLVCKMILFLLYVIFCK